MHSVFGVSEDLLFYVIDEKVGIPDPLQTG